MLKRGSMGKYVDENMANCKEPFMESEFFRELYRMSLQMYEDMYLDPETGEHKKPERVMIVGSKEYDFLRDKYKFI